MSNDSDSEIRENQSDNNAFLSRRHVLGLLSAVGVSAAAPGLASAQQDEGSGQPWYEWDEEVDANGNALRNLGSLSMASGSTAISEFVGDNLSVDDGGTLNAQEFPESVHIANEYPGETLDEKIRNIIEDVPSADPVLPRNQPGHRIVVSAPDPEDSAALQVEGSDVPIWRWEAPVVFDDNRGKIVLDMGWTLVFATDTFESFFIIGPDEKTENITINGGFLYARDNLDDSFIQFGDAGHCHLREQYLQSLEGTSPKGIHIRGGTEISVNSVEVTGCTNSLVAENVVDLDVFNHRGGGGENSIVLDGCRGVAINSVHTGSTEPQSVRNDVVRLENGNGPNTNVTITGVRSVLQAFEHHAGVSAVDVTGGDGDKHTNVNIYSVNATGAKHGTDLQWATDYDQQAITPAPADPAPHGATRHYDEGVQSFTTKDTHEFNTESGTAFVVDDEHARVPGPGSGIVLTTPDGDKRFRVRLNNNGELTTEKVNN